MPYLYTPPDVDLEADLRALDWELLAESSEYRRYVTEGDPIMFALVYLKHHLSSEETNGLVSLNDFHIDVADWAMSWARPFGPMECRRCWVAPRDCGKSTWLFLILPLWALAHGHRRFLLAFSDSREQSEEHFDTIRREFETNEWLMEDFPGLCTPRKRRGERVGADNSRRYVSESGITIQAMSMDSKMLGKKSLNVRPDLILLDDIEPKETNYNLPAKDKRLKDLEAIFPMNLNAVVVMAGTTTMFGSLIHDCVKSATGGEIAEWIREQRFRVHYYPAIITSPDGSERSLWPQRWSLKFLQSIRKTRLFWLNYMNQPLAGLGGFWQRSTYIYAPAWKVASAIITIDPAITPNDTSDYTGIGIISAPENGMECCVELAIGLHFEPKQIRDLVHELILDNEEIDTILVEKNQGGMWVLDAITPLPRRLTILNPPESEPKFSRIQRSLDCYQRDWVWHRHNLPVLEEQQMQYPDVRHDDVADAVAKGIQHYLGWRLAARPAR
jgi:hypothetical protein